MMRGDASCARCGSADGYPLRNRAWFCRPCWKDETCARRHAQRRYGSSVRWREFYDAHELQLESAINSTRSVRDAIRSERYRFFDTYQRESAFLVAAESEAHAEFKVALLAMLQYRVQQATKAGAA
jgi:hypothetical protein